MKLRSLAEETSGYTTDDKIPLNLEFLTETEEDGTHKALELVAAASMQSGLRFRKTIVDAEYETIVLDASDAEAVVLQSIYKQLHESDYSYEHGTTEHDQDIVTISVELQHEEDDGGD